MVTEQVAATEQIAPTEQLPGGAELAEAAVAAATGHGAVAIITDTGQANLRWAGNGLTTNGQMRTLTATVVAFADVPGGVATASARGAITSVAEVLARVAAAEADAASSGPAEDAQPLITPEQSGTSADFTDPAAGTTIAVFDTFAPALGAAFAAARDAGIELFGFAEHVVATTWLASTTGVRRRHVQPTGRIELNAKTPDFVRSAWVGQATADFTDVDAGALYAEVTTRLGWSERTVDLPAGRYETILPPGAIADLMIYALWSASGRDADEGRSAFAKPDSPAGEPNPTRVGERLSTLPLTLASDPHFAGIESESFMIAATSGGGQQSVFDNGLPIGRTDWLTDGVLTNLVRTRATAHGREPVSVITDNLIMTAAGATGSIDDLIASTERGLLLTCLWYIREVDPETLLLTGLTRDGVYLVENGQVTAAVNNFRFNESPIDLLGRITEASASAKTLCREWNDWFTRTVMPAVKVRDFNMSTVSQAS